MRSFNRAIKFWDFIDCNETVGEILKASFVINQKFTSNRKNSTSAMACRKTNKQ